MKMCKNVWKWKVIVCSPVMPWLADNNFYKLPEDAAFVRHSLNSLPVSCICRICAVNRHRLIPRTSPRPTPRSCLPRTPCPSANRACSQILTGSGLILSRNIYINWSKKAWNIIILPSNPTLLLITFPIQYNGKYINIFFSVVVNLNLRIERKFN